MPRCSYVPLKAFRITLKQGNYPVPGSTSAAAADPLALTRGLAMSNLASGSVVLFDRIAESHLFAYIGTNISRVTDSGMYFRKRIIILAYF